MLKRKLLALVVLVACLISSTCLAMTFNQPTKIGYYSNYRGGPTQAIGTGYTRKTADSFVYGSGDSALTIKFKNSPALNGSRGSSVTKGVYIGQNMLSQLRFFGPDIFKCTSTDGQVFYIGVGSFGMEQCFDLIGKCAGSYWNVVGMSALQSFDNEIGAFDRAGAKRFATPYAQGNKIILPYTVSNRNAGYFAFTWDDAAQWFGIDHVSL